MSIKEDSWLSSVMERSVFRVDAGEPGVASAVAEHLRGRTGYYFAKVDAANVSATKDLLRVGFFVADVNVTFAVAPSRIAGTPSPTVDVGTLTSGADNAK